MLPGDGTNPLQVLEPTPRAAPSNTAATLDLVLDSEQVQVGSVPEASAAPSAAQHGATLPPTHAYNARAAPIAATDAAGISIPLPATSPANLDPEAPAAGGPSTDADALATGSAVSAGVDAPMDLSLGGGKPALAAVHNAEHSGHPASTSSAHGLGAVGQGAESVVCAEVGECDQVEGQVERGSHADRASASLEAVEAGAGGDSLDAASLDAVASVLDATAAADIAAEVGAQAAGGSGDGCTASGLGVERVSDEMGRSEVHASGQQLGGAGAECVPH